VISFFYGNYGAGEIRGRQMGEYLKAKLNPTAGYENDVCVYVKMLPPNGIPNHSYVDVVDGVGIVPWLQKHSNCGVITTSLTGWKYLKDKVKQEVFFIPENHCNYDRELRRRDKVTTVGVIGNKKGFAIPLDEAAKRLRKIGLTLYTCDSYKSRQDVVNFYKTIDIQICWRPHVKGAHAQLHNPLKLANAASFGIPTVAWPEDNFVVEFDGAFFPAYTVDDLFRFVGELKDEPRMYEHLAKMGLEKAEKYHIEHVAKMYEELT
jgi:hypothetical protein